jgi:hypothetical protein
MISMRFLANPNRGHSQFSDIFRAHINVLFIIEVKILGLIKCSYRSLQLS